MKPSCRRPGWDGHLLALYHDESQRRGQVETWVRRGLEVDAKILHIEPRDESPARSLRGLLRNQPEAVAAMGTGQIEVVAAGPTAYDPAWQASMVERALRRYPCVRWSGDATTVWGVMPPSRHAGVERATEEVCRSGPVSVMCHYPARASLGVIGLVSAAHGAGLRDRLLQAAPIEGGLAVFGELERSNQDILRSVLLAAATTSDRDPFVVDLRGLDFIDLGGVRALRDGTARYRRLGGYVTLKAAQPHVERLIRILGVDREPRVLMEALG